MVVAQPLGFEIDFVRNPTSGSAAWFFVLILKFILTAIFEIKVHVKKFLGAKKKSFSKADFYWTIRKKIDFKNVKNWFIQTCLTPDLLARNTSKMINLIQTVWRSFIIILFRNQDWNTDLSEYNKPRSAQLIKFWAITFSKNSKIKVNLFAGLIKVFRSRNRMFETPHPHLFKNQMEIIFILSICVINICYKLLFIYHIIYHL